MGARRSPSASGGWTSLPGHSERPRAVDLSDLTPGQGCGFMLGIAVLVIMFMAVTGQFSGGSSDSASTEFRPRPSTTHRSTTTSPPPRPCHESSTAEFDLLALMYDSSAPDPVYTTAAYSVQLDGGVVAAYSSRGIHKVFLFVGQGHDDWQDDVWALNGFALNYQDSVVFDVHRSPDDGVPAISEELALEAIAPCLSSP